MFGDWDQWLKDDMWCLKVFRTIITQGYSGMFTNYILLNTLFAVVVSLDWQRRTYKGGGSGSHWTHISNHRNLGGWELQHSSTMFNPFPVMLAAARFQWQTKHCCDDDISVWWSILNQKSSGPKWSALALSKAGGSSYPWTQKYFTCKHTA